MLEKRPELTPDEVRAILAHTGKPVAGAANDQAGAGLIDPVKALTYELPPAPPVADAQVPQPAQAARMPAQAPARAGQALQPAAQGSQTAGPAAR